MAKKIYNLRDSKTDKIKSSNIVYNNKTLDMVLFPINSIIITSTNVNPSSTYGGAWELIDKEYKSMRISDSTLATGINTTVNSLMAVFGGHSVRFRCDFTTNVALTDSTIQLLTIDLAKLGITHFYMMAVNELVGSDAGDCIIMYNFHYSSGLVSSTEVISKDGTGTCPAGATAYITIVLPMDFEYMVDEFCDKFYWKRTA